MSVGIDFGTTNTAAVRLTAGLAEQIGDETRQPLPSVVAINRFTGEVEIGRSAIERISATDQEGAWLVVRSLKRDLGRDRKWTIAGRIWTVVDIAAEILKLLAKRPTSWGGERIRKATLGVPVRMTPEARRCLRHAAALADIEVTAVLKESTAACIKHRPLLLNFQHAVIFDWGGGTLDISVVRLEGHEVIELWSDGMELAGDDLDLTLARHILAKCRASSADLPEFEELSSSERMRLLYESERAKQILGTVRDHEVPVQIAGTGFTVALTREEANRELRPLVRRAIDFLARCISRAHLATNDVDRVLLVGGSSQLPLLSVMLDEDDRFQERFDKPGAPQWDVAYGAAILDSEPDGAYILADQISLILADGSECCLVHPGTQPMSSAKPVFLSLVDNANSANLIFRHGLEVKPLLHMTVPVLGFDEEELRLDYQLTPEWTFRVVGYSKSLGDRSRTPGETEELKFRYLLPAVVR